MEGIVQKIEEALGSGRLRALKADPDKYQDFWLGVLEKVEESEKDGRDPVPYLIASGYGKLMRVRRSLFSRECWSYCPACGKAHKYSEEECSVCGATLRHESRGVSLKEDGEKAPGAVPRWEDSSPDDRLDVEAFVESLPRSLRYTGRRWLLDRADLLFDSFQKQIASELSISKQAVVVKTQKIRELYRAACAQEKAEVREEDAPSCVLQYGRERAWKMFEGRMSRARFLKICGQKLSMGRL